MAYPFRLHTALDIEQISSISLNRILRFWPLDYFSNLISTLCCYLQFEWDLSSKGSCAGNLVPSIAMIKSERMFKRWRRGLGGAWSPSGKRLGHWGIKFRKKWVRPPMTGLVTVRAHSYNQAWHLLGIPLSHMPLTAPTVWCHLPGDTAKTVN